MICTRQNILPSLKTWPTNYVIDWHFRFTCSRLIIKLFSCISHWEKLGENPIAIMWWTLIFSPGNVDLLVAIQWAWLLASSTLQSQPSYCSTTYRTTRAQRIPRSSSLRRQDEGRWRMKTGSRRSTRSCAATNWSQLSSAGEDCREWSRNFYTRFEYRCHPCYLAPIHATPHLGSLLRVR